MPERYQVLLNNTGVAATHVVRDVRTGAFLGGFGTNFYRSWVFPLYTPAGLTVLQEFPFDHPFHNGAFVGQHPVHRGDRVANYWVMPPRRAHADAVNVCIGRMDAQTPPSYEVSAEGVRFSLESVWRDEEEQPILNERREVLFRAVDGATICEMVSIKRADYGALTFPQTKYGAIGVRVEPRLLPPLGAVILADSGRRGTAALVDADRGSDFVAYESDTPSGDRFGVCLLIADPGVRGPWFIRDYGMALYNPTWDRSIAVPEGDAWTIRLRVVAYDGVLTAERVVEFQSSFF